jgi:hypothetical protein
LESDFAVEIDFEPETGYDPARVFKSMSQLIDAFRNIDMHLVSSINSSIEPILMLEDIEAGSLRTWLRNRLDLLPGDDVLKDGDWKKVVGYYLVKCKHIIVRFIEGKATITTQSDVRSLEAELLAAAKETQALRIPAYEPIKRRDLLEGIQEVSRALAHLEGSDGASLITTDGKTGFNLDFRITDQTIEDLTVEENLSHEEEMILKVKKPDFLGESKWEFIYERSIEVKIEDSEWLIKFQNGEEPISPGDSLRAKVHVDVKYGYNREIVSRDYRITKVIRILHRAKPEQKLLGE